MQSVKKSVRAVRENKAMLFISSIFIFILVMIAFCYLMIEIAAKGQNFNIARWILFLFFGFASGVSYNKATEKNKINKNCFEETFLAITAFIAAIVSAFMFFPWNNLHVSIYMLLIFEICSNLKNFYLFFENIYIEAKA